MSLDDLRAKLTECIGQYSISNFDAEDIIGLISEGENVDWIAGQLKGDAPIDTNAIMPLLLELRNQLAPEKDLVQTEQPKPGTEFPAPEKESGAPSPLDLSEISSMLPEGVKLPPGMDSNQIQSLLESPQGQIMSDFLVFCQERGIDMTTSTLSESRIGRLQKEWMETPRDTFEGKKPSEMLAAVQGKVETYRRQEPQVGRNDPCPCGSGKKFKKCCGRS